MTGGGDRDTLSLYLLLFAGIGLSDRFLGAAESTESDLPLCARRGGEPLCPLRALPGEELFRLVLRGGGVGDRESYDGDRLRLSALAGRRGPLLIEELFLLFGARSRESWLGLRLGRPRGGGGDTEPEALRRLGGGEGDRL